jgi:hypothetical protein
VKGAFKDHDKQLDWHSKRFSDEGNRVSDAKYALICERVLMLTRLLCSRTRLMS